MAFTCKLGFHDWKSVYLNTDSCKILEKCSRCDAVKGEAVIIHDWECVQQNPCLSQQVCKRCGAIGQIDEKEHQWNEIYKPNSYEIQKTCESCGISSIITSGFSKFIGQEEIKQCLMILIAAARKKMEPLHHLLLCGQPGMGKVILSKIIADEMGVGFKIIAGKTIGKDILGLLTNMGKGDFLIIEQIESMQKQALDVLFQAMTDSTIDLVIDSGPAARIVIISLLHFNLIGTTTRPSQVDRRLNSLMFAFNFIPYKKDEIGKIISLSATQQGINVEIEAINLLAEQCNGCPEEALLVLKKVHKYAIAYADGQITSTIARNALAMFGSNNDSPIFERQSISDDVKIFVWQRDRGCCAKCGSQENLEYDHIIPVSKGGSNTARNIQLLCEKCNRAKSSNIV
jgi:Holliday junction resolvasome RuvABC ATP-dependent DNA helicase subunit